MTKFDRRNRKVFPDSPDETERPSRRELEDMEEDEAEYKNDLKRDRKGEVSHE